MLVIKTMKWGNAEKTSVILVADTSDGKDVTIATPYSTESIIWDYVKDYNVSQIENYVEPLTTPDLIVDDSVV